MNTSLSSRLAGYETWNGHDPFEDHAGPFFFRRHEDGSITCAFEATPTHCNGGGFLHGGMLMTFADYSLFAIGKDVLDGPCVTVSLTGEFTAAAGAGEFVESRGEVVRNTGSMVFLRGQVFTGHGADERILLNFSGIVKRVKKRPLEK
ncbi:thioesterase superfamily protein [Parvibaculum lavamentivorans DS-1]|uniref:Thioesterase superfamily protein n=1 Tax=Parvibaculum lavamentivorans (strain DS-1 / DSM 13023 / NCIMB 13966) TaxID=402881 RepID=A7HS14_PARL1|nr:thioesterase superfamily protein [Parvibaculum lavamentivorans DS-1]